MSNINNLLERRKKLLGPASLFYDEPLHLVKGEGVWVWDNDGKKYLDVYNNVPHVGHCDPTVVDAICNQLKKINIHTRYLHETILAYGERLIATLDKSLSRVFFVNSGSEANELAMRIVRKNTGGEGFIASNWAYHGNTKAVFDLATGFRDGKPGSKYVKGVALPDMYRLPDGVNENNVAEIYAAKIKDAINEFEAEGIKFAGMIFCSTFATEGILRMPDGFMGKALQYVRDAGGLYISDEVQGAFGRLGKMWGHQQYNIIPDIIITGKPMGNGHPIASVITKEKFADTFQEDGRYFNTFGGNPVSCAAGMAVLDVMEKEKLIENVNEVGAYIQMRLQNLLEKYDCIGDVRGSGLFFGLEMVKSKISKEHDGELTHKLINAMAKNGVLIRSTGPKKSVLKMRPPIIFSKDNADFLLDTLDKTLSGLIR
jgi:4-aminobutyrate aminotransferase-like enzyme